MEKIDQFGLLTKKLKIERCPFNAVSKQCLNIVLITFFYTGLTSENAMFQVCPEQEHFF